MINYTNWREHTPEWMVQEIIEMQRCGYPRPLDFERREINDVFVGDDSDKDRRDIPNAETLAEVLHASNAKNIMTGLRLELQKLGDDGLKTLLPTLLEAPNLHSVMLRNTGLTDASAPLIAELIRNKPNLRELDLSLNAFTDEGISIIAAALQRHPSIESINISGRGINPQSGMNLAYALTHSPNLTMFIANGMALSQLALEPDFMPTVQYRHKNLIDVMTVSPASMVRSFPNNNDIASALLDLVIKEGSVKDLSPSAIDAVAEYIPAIRRLMFDYPHDVPFSISESELSRERERQKIAYKRIAGFEAEWNALLANLPAVPKGKNLSIESLTTPDEKGFTPLTNPANWSKFPAIIKALAKQNPNLTIDDLLHPCSESHVLNYMLVKGHTSDVLSALNEAGIQVQRNALFQADGNPTVVLLDLAARDCVDLLFTKENWAGASPSNISKTLKALPDEVKKHIPNQHTLLAHAQKSGAPTHGQEL